MNDRFEDLLRTNPSRLSEIYDQHTPRKLEPELETVGKPHILLSFSGIEDGTFNMAHLANLSSDEFVNFAEQFKGETKDRKAFRKIFDQIMKDKLENEYNRTTVEDRSSNFNAAALKTDKDVKFKANIERSPRVIEVLDGQIFRKHDSYLNR